MTPIRHVAPGRCLERQPFEPGEVQRVPRLGRRGAPLVGYYVACPRCGARRIEPGDASPPLVEGAPVEARATVERPVGGPAEVRFWIPATLSSERRITCGACHLVYRLSGSVFVVG